MRAALILLIGLLVWPAAAYADEDDTCVREPPDSRHLVSGRGRLPGLFHYDQVHRIATGKGIGVAVIDTGVSPGSATGGNIAVADSSDVRGGSADIVDTHGTLVAGLIAGRRGRDAIGVAPDARAISIRVLDAGRGIGITDPNGKEYAELRASEATRGVLRVIELRKEFGIRVINLSLNFDAKDSALSAAIDRASDLGILVVASVGNRPHDDSGAVDRDDAYEVGENTVRFPGNHPRVLAVTAADATGVVNPDAVRTGRSVDVSAPVMDALTVSVGGSTCLNRDEASSFAAPLASGLAALLFQHFPGITPAQVKTRIEATARGGYDDSALDGHGMVQPLEALVAELDIDANGNLNQPAAYRTPEPPHTAPEPPGDALSGSRTAMLWWGLGGGGVLLAALLLRPLTSRRRATD